MQTPNRGVPVAPSAESWDDDHTPPPQMPPSLDGSDIEQVLRQHTEAIARVWDSRDLRENVTHIGKDVAELTALMRTFVAPAIKNMMGRIDRMENQYEGTRSKQERFFEYEWPAAMKALDTIGANLTRMEKDVDRIERSVEQYVKRGDEANASLRAQVAEMKAEKEKSDLRIRALEDFALTVKSKVAIFGSLAGGGVGGAAWLVAKLLG